jgi:hypothetical protein
MVSGHRRTPQRASGDTTTRGHLSLRDNSDYRSVPLKRESPSHGMRQRTGNDASGRKFRFIAAIGASAVVTVGALAVGINQGRNNVGADASSGMSTGVTVTESVAPTTPPVIRATPGITGPAPLPPEDQGLPG